MDTLENLEDAEKKSPSAGLVSLVEFVHVFVCIMSGPGTEQWAGQGQSNEKNKKTVDEKEANFNESLDLITH